MISIGCEFVIGDDALGTNAIGELLGQVAALTQRVAEWTERLPQLRETSTDRHRETSRGPRQRPAPRRERPGGGQRGHRARGAPRGGAEARALRWRLSRWSEPQRRNEWLPAMLGKAAIPEKPASIASELACELGLMPARFDADAVAVPVQRASRRASGGMAQRGCSGEATGVPASQTKNGPESDPRTTGVHPRAREISRSARKRMLQIGII